MIMIPQSNKYNSSLGGRLIAPQTVVLIAAKMIDFLTLLLDHNSGADQNATVETVTVQVGGGTVFRWRNGMENQVII